MKSKTTALFLSVFLGFLGIDRLYLGHIGIGLLKLLTGGCFGILYITDIVTIANGSLKPVKPLTYYEDSLEKVLSYNSSDILQSLDKAAKLYEQGTLNEEEYETIKAELLGKV